MQRNRGVKDGSRLTNDRDRCMNASGLKRRVSEGRRRVRMKGISKVPELIELWRAFSAWRYEDRRVKHHTKRGWGGRETYMTMERPDTSYMNPRSIKHGRRLEENQQCHLTTRRDEGEGSEYFEKYSLGIVVRVEAQARVLYGGGHSGQKVQMYIEGDGRGGRVVHRIGRWIGVVRMKDAYRMGVSLTGEEKVSDETRVKRRNEARETDQCNYDTKITSRPRLVKTLGGSKNFFGSYHHVEDLERRMGETTHLMRPYFMKMIGQRAEHRRTRKDERWQWTVDDKREKKLVK
ncbi:hypothetical protein DFH07DRAFT_781900 [Mycena maculata]|uniref:Uncharacterized protein n=1 Tax=Mycena maculata TaxID=230809 RepID=A0AAD7MR83_9AGAR|nr:hypothetical protein DFH07DRAFT_781900 [Mycena maculata]